MRITSKGQVTIPMEIRDKLGLLPNTEVDFEIDGDAVRIKKAPRGKKTADQNRRDRGWTLIELMRGKATRRMTTDEIMRLTRG